MKIRFLGAAGTVTGSRFLLETGQQKILVDCGLFQGVKKIRARNRQPLPMDPASVDAVLLTHAHIDHSGFLPALVRQGFQGPIYTSTASAELAGILLPDSARIQEEDARYANKKGFSKHRPATPLYTEQDAETALQQFAPVELEEPFEIGPLQIRFRQAGHILGAASVLVHLKGGRLLFSGDIGRYEDLILFPPAVPGEADWVVMESTYGDRPHKAAEPLAELKKVLERAIRRRGVIVIPSFAVGRAQAMLYCLYTLFADHGVPEIPVYVDSPMATSVTRVYRKYDELHKLSKKTTQAALGLPRFVSSVNESKKLSASTKPAVIISASGMATAGRVLHHLKAFLPKRRNTVILPSFQAPGTRGAALAHGAEAVKIHGQHIPVRARVVQLDLFSAHAGQNELMRWSTGLGESVRNVFLVHGEPEPADTLRQRLEEEQDRTVHIPDHLEEVELG